MGDTMELRDILQIIWRRLRLITFGTLLATTAALIISLNLTPVYRAKVTMKVDQPASAPLAYSSITTGENLALTYSRLLRTRPLLEMVTKNLGLDITPDELKENISTNLVPETPLVELAVKDSDAERAAEIANEIAFTFRALQNLERQVGNIAAFEEDMLAQMAELKTLIGQNQALIRETMDTPNSPAQEARRRDLQATLATQQSTYANLLSAYLDIQLTQSQFFNVDVVELAIPPAQPIRPRIPLYTSLGACLGLMASTGAAFLREYLDRSLKTSEDVRRAVARPTLGIIPRLQGAEHRSALIAGTAPHSAIAEAFRTLRTNIRFTGVDRPLTSLIVSSAEPGAGKTTVAVNLGIVYAQAGFRVVVIDADLRLPRLHKSFGFANTTGLTDLLVGTQDVAAYLTNTEISNLRLLVAGPIPPNPSELLGSKRMADVLKGLKAHADLVIIDTPPVLPVTDTAVLAPKVDGILLVARAHTTQRDTIRHATENLTQVGGNVIGAVLNAAPIKPRSIYYPYYGLGKGPIPSFPAGEAAPVPVRPATTTRARTRRTHSTHAPAPAQRPADAE